MRHTGHVSVRRSRVPPGGEAGVAAVLRSDPTPRAHHRPYRRFGVGVLVSTALVAVSWALVVRFDVSAMEERTFRIVNDAADVWWPVLWPAMQLGNLAAPVAVAAAMGAALRRWRPSVALLAAGYGAWAVAQAVKDLVARDRPEALLPDVVLREGVQGLGFVSGHAAVATAMATVVWPYLTARGRATVVMLALMVGLGRIYAGAHLPLDVIGGAAIGVLVGLAVNAAVGLPGDTLQVLVDGEHGQQ